MSKERRRDPGFVAVLHCVLAFFSPGPWAGAAEDDIYLYVSNAGAHNVVVAHWSEGEGFEASLEAPGELVGPTGLASADGVLYVGSGDTGAILRFDTATREYLGTFYGGPLFDGPPIEAPWGLAVDSTGRLLAASRGGGTIWRFDTRPDGVGGPFIDLVESGIPYVLLLTESRVQDLLVTLDPPGALLDFAASNGEPQGPGIADIDGARGIAIDGEGRLNVALIRAHEIRRYDLATGAYLDTFVSAGAGGLSSPHGIAFGPDGHLYVASIGTGQIKRYHGKTGEFIGDAGGSMAPSLPILLFFDGPGLERPRIHWVDPDVVRPEGGDSITVVGRNFLPGDDVKLLGGSRISLAGGEILDSRHFRGTSPPMAAGVYDAVLFRGGFPVFTLEAALTVAAPPNPIEVTGIAPYHLASPGGTAMEIRGENFRPEMKVFFGRSSGDSVEVPFTFVSPTTVVATAPPFPAGKVVLVAGLEGEPLTELQDAAQYVSPGDPAPQNVEATLVDGIAELKWFNPLPYQRLMVYRDGRITAELPGDATSFLDAGHIAPGTAMSYRLVAEIDEEYSSMVDLVAATRICDPPAGYGTADRGPTNFKLHGGHAPFTPGGGAGGEGGGGAALWQYPVVENSQFLLMEPLFYGPGEVVTGFTLLKPSKKLRIGIHGTKLLGATDLTLRILIESVTDGVTRAEEIVMPGTLIRPRHDWMELTFNTEKPPRPPGAAADPPPVPPFPAADYHLKIYAVGGDPEEIHYSISSDFSPDQILVPGLGCPPYPLVRVEDTTDRNSNPVILGIEQHGETKPFFPTKVDGVLINSVIVTLKANVMDPDLPEDPIVNYRWEILTGLKDKKTQEPEVSLADGPASTAMFILPTYGYYLATLEVMDQRCGKSRREFVVKVHPPCITPATGSGPNFTFPSPRPDRLHFLTDIPGGMDGFSAPVPAEFRAFVVDSTGCQGTAQTKSVQFALADPGNTTLAIAQGYILNVNGSTGMEEQVLDPALAQDQSGGRFWVAEFADMNLLPAMGTPTLPAKVRLVARASTIPAYTSVSPTDPNWGPWKPVRAHEASGAAIASSNELSAYRKPRFLDIPGDTHATGSYEPDFQTYHFALSMAEPEEATFSTATTPFEISLAGVEIPFPSLKNGVQAVDQTVYLSFTKGTWAFERHDLGVSAMIQNGLVTGDVTVGYGGGAGSGGSNGVFDPTQLTYDQVRCDTLFEDSFSSALFSGVLYEGLVGPVQVTITGSVAIGASVRVNTLSELHLQGLNPSNPYRADFWLLPGAKLLLSSALRADIFFGVANVTAGLDLEPTFKMPFHLYTDSSGVHKEWGLRLALVIDFWVKACINALVDDFCFPPVEENLVTKDFFNTNAGLAVPACVGSGGGDTSGGGGLATPLNAPDHQLAIASSPDGSLQVAVGLFDITQFSNNPLYPHGFHVGHLLRQKGSGWSWPPIVVISPAGPQWAEYYSQTQRDPRVVFLDQSTVLLAWTQSFAKEDPALPPKPPDDIATFNQITRRDEIVYMVGVVKNLPQQPGEKYIDWGPAVRLSVDPQADGYHPDGRVALAAIPGQDAAWAAWVRFETPDMGYEAGGESRIRMKKTGIFARKIAGGQPSGGMVHLSGANDAIDIEPTIAAAADGTAVAVWVNDPLNDDLASSTTQNASLRLLYAKTAGGSWSAPKAVLASFAPYPGVLEPSFALKDSKHGMLAFTALPSNAPSNDMGLFNTRLLYTSKFTVDAGGIDEFEQPVLLSKKCNTPIFAHWPNVIPKQPTPVEEPDFTDFTLIVHEVGPAGTPLGGGSGLVFFHDESLQVWSEPKVLTPPGRVRQGFAGTVTGGGEIILLHESPAALDGGAGEGGGGESFLGEDIVALERTRTADPAISHCRLSDAYAGPGAVVTATVGIANRGFAPTPADAGGESLVSLTVHHEKEDGGRVQVARAAVPVLAAGEETFLPFSLTIPREPVRIIVEVDGVPGELDPADNVRNCALGAQPPRDLSCVLVEGADGEAVELRWTNGGSYDRILVERDGLLLARLPGSAQSHVDPARGFFPGTSPIHEYSVRGEIASSRSIRARCSIDLGDAGGFRRGDVDENGSAQITDAIKLLLYLFQGGEAPSCSDAADADDNGFLQITDPIRILNYLFQGTADIPAPGSHSCGIDPTPDGLETCAYRAECS